MKTETEKICDKMMKMGCSDWRKFVERRTRHRMPWQAVVNQLNFMTVRYAMLAEYVAERTGEYCGNHAEHEDAVKETLKTRAKVRKAIGYSIPTAGEFTF